MLNTMKNATHYERSSQATILNPLKSLYNESGSFFYFNSTRMNTHVNPATEFETEPAVSIKPLIDKLINSVLHTSVEHRTLIINEVPPHFQFEINENKLALVIGNLIRDIISFTQDDCLHICVLGNGEIILRLENTNLSRNKSFVVSLETMLIIAERFGISLKIEEFYGKGSDVSIHFLKKVA